MAASFPQLGGNAHKRRMEPPRQLAAEQIAEAAERAKNWTSTWVYQEYIFDLRAFVIYARGWCRLVTAELLEEAEESENWINVILCCGAAV